MASKAAIKKSNEQWSKYVAGVATQSGKDPKEVEQKLKQIRSVVGNLEDSDILGILVESQFNADDAIMKITADPSIAKWTTIKTKKQKAEDGKVQKAKQAKQQARPRDQSQRNGTHRSHTTQPPTTSAIPPSRPGQQTTTTTSTSSNAQQQPHQTPLQALNAQSVPTTQSSNTQTQRPQAAVVSKPTPVGHPPSSTALPTQPIQFAQVAAQANANSQQQQQQHHQAQQTHAVASTQQQTQKPAVHAPTTQTTPATTQTHTTAAPTPAATTQQTTTQPTTQTHTAAAPAPTQQAQQPQQQQEQTQSNQRGSYRPKSQQNNANNNGAINNKGPVPQQSQQGQSTQGGSKWKPRPTSSPQPTQQAASTTTTTQQSTQAPAAAQQQSTQQQQQQQSAAVQLPPQFSNMPFMQFGTGPAVTLPSSVSQLGSLESAFQFGSLNQGFDGLSIQPEKKPSPQATIQPTPAPAQIPAAQPIDTKRVSEPLNSTQASVATASTNTHAQQQQQQQQHAQQQQLQPEGMQMPYPNSPYHPYALPGAYPFPFDTSAGAADMQRMYEQHSYQMPQMTVPPTGATQTDNRKGDRSKQDSKYNSGSNQDQSQHQPNPNNAGGYPNPYMYYPPYAMPNQYYQNQYYPRGFYPSRGAPYNFPSNNSFQQGTGTTGAYSPEEMGQNAVPNVPFGYYIQPDPSQSQQTTQASQTSGKQGQYAPSDDSYKNQYDSFYQQSAFYQPQGQQQTQQHQQQNNRQSGSHSQSQGSIRNQY